MWVLHVDTDHDAGQGPGIVTDRIDTMTYVVPANRAVEVKNDFHAEKLLEHKAFHGMVEVQFETDENGVKLDVAGAKKRAKKALYEAERNAVARYIKTQLEDRVRLNYPPFPPDARTEKLLIKHGVDLGAQGIRPPGWKMPDTIPQSTPLVESNNRVEELAAQNKVLADALKKSNAAIEALNAKVDELAAVQQGEPAKEPPPTPKGK